MTVEQIVMAVGKNVRAKQDGWLLSCPYPDHSDSTASFSVRLDGVFFCWGCQKRGNYATLLHDFANFSWKRAQEQAKTLGLCTPRPVLGSIAWDKQRPITNVISKGLLGLYAVDWQGGYRKYKAAVANGDDDFPAWCFPFIKGFTPETLDFFHAGFDNEFQRVTIPVHDRNSNLVGFVGRTCIGADQKYMVYPPLMPSHHVYGLHRITRSFPYILLVEGPWDVWMVHQLDPKLRAVAVMTSHVQQDQFLQLAKAHKHYVIMFDADSAGKKGALQVASALLTAGAIIDIARTPHADMKRLTREELRVALEERQPFPSIELGSLHKKKGQSKWQSN